MGLFPIAWASPILALITLIFEIHFKAWTQFQMWHSPSQRVSWHQLEVPVRNKGQMKWQWEVFSSLIKYSAQRWLLVAGCQIAAQFHESEQLRLDLDGQPITAIQERRPWIFSYQVCRLWNWMIQLSQGLLHTMYFERSPKFKKKRLMNLKHFHLFYFCSPDDKRASNSILHLFDAGVHVVLRDIWRIWEQWRRLLLGNLSFTF